MSKLIDIKAQVDDAIKPLGGDYNKILGHTTLQPFRPANSGNRALMTSVHSEHLLVPANGEVPIVGTSYETEFAEYSSSKVTANTNYAVIAKISKYETNNYHYYLIVQDLNNGIYDYIERVPYKHNTESYGFMWDNKYLDRLEPGKKIDAGQVIKTSTGYDEVGNKKNGVNLVTAYLSLGKNLEDSVIISEEAAEKLATHLIRPNSIPINDNDVLLNLYGDDSVYKTFPDIGENIRQGLFCGVRRLENDSILYSLSQANLRDIMISDRLIQMEGTVAEIDVYCNNPSILTDSPYNQQLLYYHNQKIAFSKQIVDVIGPLYMNGANLSYRLQMLYADCRDAIAGKLYFKDRPFSNVYLDIVIIQRSPASIGDKLCDRFGGKGVISYIWPNEKMPYIAETGKRVEIIKNQSTCINRENLGQEHEQSLTFLQMRILDYLKSLRTTTSADNYIEFEQIQLQNTVISYREQVDLVLRFLKLVDDDMYNEYKICFEMKDYDEYYCKLFIDSILDDDAIFMSIPPFTTKIRLDTLADIYDEFPWINQYTVMMPILDSNDNLRFIPATRKMVIGKTYNYRLKQYAEEKFSATSLSATNQRGLNTRTRASKRYEDKYNSTPIMFGGMEAADMGHMGVETVVMALMAYSSSPQARMTFQQLLTGDPYNIDIKLDTDAKNRYAEIINAIMHTMGLELVFEKYLKEKKQMVALRMFKDVPIKDFKYRTNVRDIIGHDGELDILSDIAKRDKSGKTMVGRVMVSEVKNDE